MEKPGKTTIMDKSLGTLAFLGCFPVNMGPTLPSPHKQCWLRVSWIFSEFQLCTLYRVGGRENWTKVLKRMTVLMREPRNDRKIWILQYCPKDFLSRIVKRFSSSYANSKHEICTTWPSCPLTSLCFTVYYFYHKLSSFTLVMSCF